MALTQMQLIQSLGEAMAWFEREINWGVKPTELRHLCGRIGELYVAMITNGQMAKEVNQKGYDVVSGTGGRISVKTTAMAGTTGHVSFNQNSSEFVDRVIILRINTEEMQVEILLDCPVSDAMTLMAAEADGRRSISLSRLLPKISVVRNIKTTVEVSFQGYVIKELESGTIEILKNGAALRPVKPILRKLALELNVSLLNEKGNPFNTRQLGNQVISSIQELRAPGRR